MPPEIEYRIVNHQFRTVSEFARLLKGSTAFRLALTGTDPVMKDYPYQTMAMHVPTFRGMAETGKFAAYLDEFMGNFEKASKENERYMSFSELVRGFNAEYLKSTGLDKKGIKNPLRRGEPMPIGMLDRLARDVKNASRQVIDEEASLKLATKAMPDAEYFAACDALAEKIYGHPMAKQGRKMVPLTAEIAAQMMGSGKRNLEKTMTFGAGKIKAMGAIKFRDFMHMTKSKGMLDTDENIEASHTETDKLQTKYRDGASDHYAYSNMWDALDDAMKALAIAGKKKNATTADLRRELTKLNFTTGEIPEDILQAGIDSLKAIHGSKVPYFEGKPERPVKLNEFVGAVVPDDAPNNVVELLQKHGLAVVKASYENRLAAVTSLANQLEKSKGGVMFESATGILESMTPEIRYLYDYLKSPAWEDLPFQMNYLLGRWLETQDIEFPEEAGTEDYEQIEWMRLHDKANYQAFGEWLETQDDEGDGQTKKYFDDNPKIVNNIWCLHFTDNADDVWREGFTFGTDDMELLGLTSFRRSVKNGKWGFAFDAANTSWRKYKGQHGGLKYGDSAVMFKASGVKVYHYSDDEDQVIFDTRTVTDIVQLEKISYPIDGLETSVWAVVDRKGHPLYHTGDNTIEDLDNAAMWVIKHYDQYKNAIHTGHAPAASRKAKFESEDDEVLKLSNNMIEIRMDSRPDVTGALDEIKNTYEQFERNRYLFTDAAMFEASRFGDSIYLTSVFVLPEERKSGLATKMMDAICDIVDRHNVNIVIFPKRMGNDGLTTPELKKWYAKFGFKNSDQGNMLRTPARVSGNPSTKPRCTILGFPWRSRNRFRNPTSSSCIMDSIPCKKRSWQSSMASAEKNGPTGFTATKL
jgi:GNAT superfamily N-acetyltransferase